MGRVQEVFWNGQVIDMRIQICRICKGKNLAKFLDLGLHPPSDAFLRSERLFRE